MSAIDEIIWLLKDGQWHDLGEIEKCSVPPFKAATGIRFLREYNFIQVDEKRQRAKLTPMLRNFLEEIQSVERDEAHVMRALKVR